MVYFQEKKIYINGKTVFLLSGEVHYFRLARENWQSILDEAKEEGLNCISSYVPWILHEEKEGEYDFEDNLNLGAFIDLCETNGFLFFVRPGPFIMSEMKKEGIPYWVAEKHPDALPVGFDGERRESNTLDYLNPGYLDECRKWYQKVMQIIVPRLHCNGGNIIGIQLDNEIGMLNWVSNYPVLNDGVLNRMRSWLEERYGEAERKERYPFWNEADFAEKLRTPEESYTAEFHLDFGMFMRDYYAEYIRTLKEYATECGVRDTPLFINIHGTGDARIYDFPLGISQLYKGYNENEGLISGTDVYLGEPTEGKYQDLYVINAITDCMNKKGNPLTSIEFECNDAPYCSLSGMRYHPTATSHKMLMCLSQNARMLNFYVFNGGVNRMLKYPKNDGDGRSSFTGELHGWNAPVQPDGTRNYSFAHIAHTAKTIHALNELIGDSRQVTDAVSLAYIPDYFLTEAVYEKSEKMQRIANNLKRFRCQWQIDNIARAMLDQHIQFDAVDIQNGEPEKGKVLVVLSARYMARDVQQKLVDFLEAGGRVLLYGEVPEYDMEEHPCTVLKDALYLGVPVYRQSFQPSYFASMTTCGSFAGTTTSQPVSFTQCFPKDGSEILESYEKDMCGFIKKVKTGKICAITGKYPADKRFWTKVFAEMDLHPGIEIDYYRDGIYAARTSNGKGQELLYLINLDCEDKVIDVKVDGTLIWKNFELGQKASLLLPRKVDVSGVTVVKSTAEITGVEENEIHFTLTQTEDEIWLQTMREVLPGDGYTVTVDGVVTVVRSQYGRNKEIVIKLR